jgi:hypothetical protein
MAGYIGNKAVGLNVTTGDILGDVGVGGDLSTGTLKTSGQLSIATTSAGNSLGSFLNQGTGANFYEASDGTKTMIAGTDGGNDFVKLGSLSSHPVGFVAGNSEKFRIATDGSLSTPTAGTSNVRFGVNAGNSIASGGNYNVFLGDEAGTACSTGDANVGIGFNALKTQTTTGINTAVGFKAGESITSGVENNLFGSNAGDSLTDADYNVAMGVEALAGDTKGSNSVAIGHRALFKQNFANSTNTFNTAVGYTAGQEITTGTLNTFIGGQAGDGTDDGASNTAVGYASLSANCGNSNTATGRYALTNCTGGNNTAIGDQAGNNVTSGSNNIFLGKDAGITGSPGGNITTGTNNIVVGDENNDAAYIQIDWTVASDQRDKTDFTALDLGLDFVKALAPVTYKWDKRSKYGDKFADDYDLNAQSPDGTHKEEQLDVGFKAQEVEALEISAGYKIADKTNLVTSLTSDGKQYGMQYSKFVPILVKAIQEQNALIEALTARIATLEE